MRPRFLNQWLMFLLAIMAVFGAAVPFASAQEQSTQNTFVVMGSGSSATGDDSAARQAAIANALAAAVGRATQSLMSAEELKSRFKDLDGLVFRHSEKYIMKYQVLGQSQAGQQYRVLLEARVDVNKINAQLNTYGVVESKREIPILLLLIAEQNIDDYAPRFWWGTQKKDADAIAMQAMVKALKAQGLEVLSPDQVRAREDVDWKRFNKAELTFREAANLGARVGADLVIVGNSLAVPSSAEVGSDMQALKGNVSAHVINAKSAEQITKITQTALGMHTDEVEAGVEALSNAGRIAGQALSGKIIQAWQTRSVTATQIAVTVEGTKNLINFVKFRRTLSSIDGVEKVQIKEMGTNTAALLVDFKGTGPQLADVLKKESFESFGIQIIEVTDTDLKLILVSG